MVVEPALPDSASGPLRPLELGATTPLRSAALQRRAMQAAMATAVRELRSINGRRPRRSGPYGASPAGRG
jgi:hypothetical protein